MINYLKMMIMMMRSKKNDKQIVIYEINLTNLILKKNLMKSNFPATRGEN